MSNQKQWRILLAVRSAADEDREVNEARLFPLPGVVLFPNMRLPLHVFEPRYRRLVEDALSSDHRIAVVRLRPGYESDYYGCPPIYEVFGIGTIVEHRKLADGRFNIVVEGRYRARSLSEVRREPYRVNRAEILRDAAPSSSASAAVLQSELRILVKRLLPHLSPPTDALKSIVSESCSPGQCSDGLAANLVSDPDVRQALLEELDPVERMTQLIARLHDLLMLAGVRSTPNSELN